MRLARTFTRTLARPNRSRSVLVLRSSLSVAQFFAIVMFLVRLLSTAPRTALADSRCICRLRLSDVSSFGASTKAGVVDNGLADGEHDQCPHTSVRATLPAQIHDYHPTPFDNASLWISSEATGKSIEFFCGSRLVCGEEQLASVDISFVSDTACSLKLSSRQLEEVVMSWRALATAILSLSRMSKYST